MASAPHAPRARTAWPSPTRSPAPFRWRARTSSSRRWASGRSPGSWAAWAGRARSPPVAGLPCAGAPLSLPPPTRRRTRRWGGASRPVTGRISPAGLLSHSGGVMRVQLVEKGNGPERLVSDAEVLFDEDLLAGMKLVGFSLWRSTDGDVYVTFPSRAFGAGTERKYFDYLRSAEGLSAA